MGQTYPLPITAAMVRLVDDGTPNTNPSPADPASAAYTTPPDWNPKTWADKATNHPVGDPDFVFVTLVTKSMNMPY